MSVDPSEHLYRLVMASPDVAMFRGVHGGPSDDTETAVPAESRGDWPAPGPRPALFLWGSLRVLERVGEGGGGEVYRAYDPALETEVALKLRRRGAFCTGIDPKRFLDEARRLARVRHPNVLAVRGAGEHDGRIGLWTDFIQGRSLEDCLRQEGPLSAREAALIGLDLCRALAAVHAGGLVHRDVKTGNVMRELGGRIVLMDFGSVAEIAPTEEPERGGLDGTPLVMAPEQLRGGPAGSRTDIYALGVLLYRLVTCRYPVEANDLPGLLDLHGRGARVPLRDRRPDLPLEFVQVVERALAGDPSQRFESAGAMEAALSASIGEHPLVGTLRPARASWRGLAVATAAAVGLAAGAILLGRFTATVQGNGPVPAVAAGSASPAPRITAPAPHLEASASLFRRTGTQDRPLPTGGGRVRPGDRLFLNLKAREPMYTYVLNEDDAGAVYVLFPIPGVSPTNPLSPTVRYRLPGSMGDSLVYWTVTSVGGREGVVVIGSRAPLGELEDVVTRVPRAEPGRPIRFGRIDDSRLGSLRSIGGIVKEGTVAADTHRRLEETVQALDERRKERGDVWIWRANLKNPAP